MDNLLSIVTFIPALAALILVVFLRGDDAAAKRNAKWLALIATSVTFLCRCSSCCSSTPPTPASSSSKSATWLLGPELQDGRGRDQRPVRAC